MPALSLLGGPTLQILAPAFPESGPGLHKGRDAGAFALGGPRRCQSWRRLLPKVGAGSVSILRPFLLLELL